MDNTIHICLALHDASGSYYINTAATIKSIIGNTQSHISFYLLCDNTVSDEIRRKFVLLVATGNHTIQFIDISIPCEWSAIKYLKQLGIGTLFRLMIPDVLPQAVDKVIYLDSDILVNLDVAELWSIDFNGSPVLGRRDVYHDNPLFAEGISHEMYINAGIMALNLKLIRENHHFFKDAISFFKTHPDCMFLDQDAINYIFNGTQTLLDIKYNTFTLSCREKKEYGLDSKIYHFAGDLPRAGSLFAFDRLYFESLNNTVFANDMTRQLLASFTQLQNESHILMRTLLNILAGRSLLFWGAVETRAFQKLQQIIELSTITYEYIDNDRQKQLDGFEGHMVHPVADLADIQNPFIIVLAYNHYSDISEELKGMGFIEHQDFINAQVFGEY